MATEKHHTHSGVESVTGNGLTWTSQGGKRPFALSGTEVEKEQDASLTCLRIRRVPGE